jgi:hypothetical protein
MAAGFAMQEVAHLRRHKRTPKGPREVRWSVLRPQPGVMPEGRVQFAYCHTPELTWAEPSPPLANGADALSDILLIVADPHEATERFARFAGRDAVAEGRFMVVPLDRGRLVFGAPDVVAAIPDFTPPHVPYMAGQAVRCTGLDRLRTMLDRAGIRPLIGSDDFVCLRPDDGLGSLMLFHDPAAASPWAALAG